MGNRGFVLGTFLDGLGANDNFPKTCQNRQNIIVDAERLRRTPGTPVT